MLTRGCAWLQCPNVPPPWRTPPRPADFLLKKGRKSSHHGIFKIVSVLENMGGKFARANKATTVAKMRLLQMSPFFYLPRLANRLPTRRSKQVRPSARAVWLSHAFPGWAPLDRARMSTSTLAMGCASYSVSCSGTEAPLRRMCAQRAGRTFPARPRCGTCKV
jgi:transposase